LYKDNKCFFCKKLGHKLQDCRQKKAETKTANVTQETALMAMTTNAVSETTWIADLGATCHITNDLTGLYDIEHVETPVTLGDRTTVTAMMNAKLKLKMEGPEGPTTVMLYDMKYIPEFMLKLFSLSCAMKKGANIQNEGMILKVQKGDLTLSFKNCAEMQNGCILGLELVPMTSHTAQMMALAASELNVTILHIRLGHVSNDITTKTAKLYGWKVTRMPKDCKLCELVNAQQKNLSKEKVKRCANKGEWLFLDISSTKYISYRKSKFWLLVMDDATDHCWSFFLKAKSETAEVMINFIKKLKDIEDVSVKNIQCDNVGKNKAFQNHAEQEHLVLKCEYTACKTPQHNGQVKHNATFFGHAHAMMNDAGFVGKNIHLRHGLWAEAVGTATKI